MVAIRQRNVRIQHILLRQRRHFELYQHVGWLGELIIERRFYGKFHLASNALSVFSPHKSGRATLNIALIHIKGPVDEGMIQSADRR